MDPLQAYLNRIPEWSDETRIRALFAQFPDKDVKPTAYSDQLKFWKSIICEACSQRLLGKDTCGFAVDHVERKFVRSGVHPAGLRVVLVRSTLACNLTLLLATENLKFCPKMEMQNTGVLLSGSAFEEIQNGGHYSWPMWAYATFVRFPIEWTFKMLTASSEDEPRQYSGFHILIPRLMVFFFESMLQACLLITQ